MKLKVSKAHGYVCDVTNEEQVNAFVAQVEKEVRRNRYSGEQRRYHQTVSRWWKWTAAEFRQVIDIDLNGPFIVSKAVIPSMIKKGHGKIINICSMMSETRP